MAKGEEPEDKELLLHDCERVLRYLESSLAYNPWDAYLDDKVRQMKRLKRKIRKLRNELEKTNKGG